MKVSDFVVNSLIEAGVTDAFGIPGGVILPLIYSLDESCIEPHLTYHEQTAGFAACGYAHASGKLGVAYATRGPGICNMFTSIAEAYQESLPVLFITAHEKKHESKEQRFISSQEMSIVSSVRNITKYAVEINNIDDVCFCVKHAINKALVGRKGPTLIDMDFSLWDKDVPKIDIPCFKETGFISIDKEILLIKNKIESSSRPIFLIGDGLRHICDKEKLIEFFNSICIPVISSRGSQDLVSSSHYYFGYIGSHGIRYSNFILSKADLIISLGNRMNFHYMSGSFSNIVKNANIVRIDIDEGELKRKIPGEIGIHCDAKLFLQSMEVIRCKYKQEWINKCNYLKSVLIDEDCTEPVRKIAEFIKMQPPCSYVCDVGNNEFWFSRAFERVGCSSTLLTSKSFGSLGSAIGKSIGAYYATKDNVICVVGDQGFQYNIQELQYIVTNKLPIKILIINNECSRMIADHELKKFGERFLHVTSSSGYHVPNFMEIARAYGVDNKICEIKVDSNCKLSPSLPKNRLCQDLEPFLDRKKFSQLNKL